MRVGSLFSGHGQLDFGLCLAGFDHAWFCESDPWRRDILSKRWPGVPIFEDIRELGSANAGPVDVIAGGFPCKGVSGAGKEEGFGHPETVLWREMRRVVGELRPRYVLIENVARLLGLHRGELFGEVLGDLATLGHDGVWDCLPAAAFGAPHRRDRVLAVAAYADGSGRGAPERDVRARELDSAGSAEAPADTSGRAAQLRGERRVLHGQAGEAEAEGDQRERCGDAVADRSQAAPDTDQRLLPAGRNGSGGDGDQADPRGVAVDWGEYGPAIERWERIHGPAPEPLVRRVDARPAAKVERSQLSALGDGVQVDLGIAAGEYIQQLKRERLK